jgi:hypothetical protein
LSPKRSKRRRRGVVDTSVVVAGVAVPQGKLIARVISPDELLPSKHYLDK